MGGLQHLQVCKTEDCNAEFDIHETNKVKCVAIMLLIFHHLFLTPEKIESRGIEAAPFVLDFTAQLARSSRVCVWMFAFLSAYGLTITFAKNHRHWLVRRYFRLMGPYWLVILLTWIMILALPSITLSAYKSHPALYSICDFFAVSDLLGFPKLVGTYWYMSFALVQMTLLPLFYYLCRRIGWPIIPATIIIIHCLGKGIESPEGGNYYWYVVVTELGILFAQNDSFRKINSIVQGTLAQIIEITFILFISILLPIIAYHFLDNEIWCIRSSILSISCIGWCVLCYKYVHFSPITRVMSLIGEYSGVMYLVHTIVYLDFPYMICWSGSIFITWICCIVVSLLVSLVIKCFMEYSGYGKLINRVSNIVISRLDNYGF